MGNRLTATGQPSWVYDPQNDELDGMGAVTYTYDLNGNRSTKVESGSTTTYSYDPENRLVRVDLPGGTYVAFAYDALGRRVRTRSSNGTVRLHWYKDEDRVLETDPADPPAEKVRYTHGPGIDNPLKVRVSGNSYYFHEDGLGSIGYLTASSRNTKITYRYDAFGRIVYQNQNGSISGYTNAWTYTGREWDAELNLYYYRARHYDPRTGRFLQVDSVGHLERGTNLYAYVRSNPINFRDPSGLWPRYGNWCGPGYPKGNVYPLPPAVDSLDELCRKHDLCYLNYGFGDKQCDRDLLEGCWKLPKNPTDWCRKPAAPINADIYRDWVIWFFGP